MSPPEWFSEGLRPNPARGPEEERLDRTLREVDDKPSPGHEASSPSVGEAAATPGVGPGDGAAADGTTLRAHGTEGPHAAASGPGILAEVEAPGEGGRASPHAMVEDVQGALGVAGDGCRDAGCGRAAVRACVYRDREGQGCVTQWCAEHSVVIQLNPYCRRHANVMGALLDRIQEPVHLPEPSNRAPSLATWIGRDLDLRVRLLVRRLRDDAVLVDNLGPVGGAGGFVWRYSWSLPDAPTPLVAAEVAESYDEEVRLTVSERVVWRGVPPWISARLEGLTLDPEDDESRREDFYDVILGAVERSLGEPVAATARPATD